MAKKILDDGNRDEAINDEDDGDVDLFANEVDAASDLDVPEPFEEGLNPLQHEESAVNVIHRVENDVGDYKGDTSDDESPPKKKFRSNGRRWKH